MVDKKNWLVPVAVLLIVTLFGCLLVSCNSKAGTYNAERFFGDIIPDNALSGASKDISVAAIANASANPNAAGEGVGQYEPSNPYGDESYSQVVAGSQVSGSPGNCFPRDRLAASDLLPAGASDARWAQANPAGQGDVMDQNFLSAGYHVGVNTIGSSMKNPSLDLRSEPINPQMVVSPWNISTIDPNVMQRSFEIGSGA